uniref:Uncharacterized protein n=1 Tax=Anguilla anguilla TaxID=7936 RepID=A0A0E9WH87_ANGAN
MRKARHFEISNESQSSDSKALEFTIHCLRLTGTASTDPAGYNCKGPLLYRCA